jgi:hypothetical protein
LLYAAGVTFVRSGGNDNGNFRLPTLDELLAVIEGLIDRGMRSGRWSEPRPEILFPWHASATPPRRMTLEEYRTDLWDRKVTLDDESDYVINGRSRLDEFGTADAYWNTALELRIREPEVPLPSYCGASPDAEGTLSAFDPWCGDGFRSAREAPLKVPNPCVSAPGVYCNDGMSTIDSPCGPTTVLAAAWNLDDSPPGVASYSSYGGTFMSAGGRLLARAGIAVAGLVHFRRPAFPIDGGVAEQTYFGVGFGGTSGAAPTITAVMAALAQRLPERWRGAWSAEAHEALQLTHPGLLHALLLALADGTGITPAGGGDPLIWAGLHPQLGAGRIRADLAQWVLGSQARIGPRRAMSLGVLRGVQPGSAWRLPSPAPAPTGARLRSAAGSLFFVDPRYAATGEVATTVLLQAWSAAGGSGRLLAQDDGRIAGIDDAMSVENRRRLRLTWSSALPATRPLWRVRVPRLNHQPAGLPRMDVWYALIEEYA